MATTEKYILNYGTIINNVKKCYDNISDIKIIQKLNCKLYKNTTASSYPLESYGNLSTIYSRDLVSFKF